MPARVAVFLLLLHSTMTARRVVVFPTREIGDFRSYRDGTFLHFRFPEEVHTAVWNFTAFENKIYGISNCEPRPVNVFIKYSGYPMVNLDNSSFPPDYFQRNDTVYHLQFDSNSRPILFNISIPQPGDWFAVGFNDYVDPDDMAIQQSGLVRVCVALLDSSIDLTLTGDLQTLTSRPIVSTFNPMNELMYKFRYFVPTNISKVTIELFVQPPASLPKDSIKSLVYVDTSVLISNDEFVGTRCYTGEWCKVTFSPVDKMCVYITVTLDDNFATFEKLSYNLSAVSELIPPDACDSGVGDQCWTPILLTRRTYTGFFTYGFERTTFENEPEVPGINISTKDPSVLNFQVNPIQDIGGTISIEIGMDSRNIKDYESQFRVILLVCVSHEIRLMPQFPDICASSSGLELPNQLQVNSTSESKNTHINRLHIAYPESGEWFVTMKAFCFTGEASESVSEVDCGTLAYINASFIVESLPCGADKCGRFGRCSTQMDGGLLFSTCYCLYGYRGWGCTDDSKVAPQYELLIGTLLLTLSNLFFIPAIVVSLRRRFYTEALVYAFAMFFSTFYHACDSGEGTYTFCILNLSILQFCDFYSAVMAMWVTIIAMANVPPPLCSLAHMAGAVFIALGTEYNRTSLLLFLIPAIIGLAIMTTSWVLRCRRSRSCYPEKSYWMYFLPPGLVFLLVGLLCFSFLQTQRNYKYVHSAWHSLMAMSILFVLPRSRQKIVSIDLQEIHSESRSSTESSDRNTRTQNGWPGRKN